MEPNEVMRRFEEAVKSLPIKPKTRIIFYPYCPASFGLSPRELGYLRNLAMMAQRGRVNLEEWK